MQNYQVSGWNRRRGIRATLIVGKLDLEYARRELFSNGTNLTPAQLVPPNIRGESDHIQQFYLPGHAFKL